MTHGGGFSCGGHSGGHTSHTSSHHSHSSAHHSHHSSSSAHHSSSYNHHHHHKHDHHHKVRNMGISNGTWQYSSSAPRTRLSFQSTNNRQGMLETPVVRVFSAQVVARWWPRDGHTVQITDLSGQVVATFEDMDLDGSQDCKRKLQLGIQEQSGARVFQVVLPDTSIVKFPCSEAGDQCLSTYLSGGARNIRNLFADGLSNDDCGCFKYLKALWLGLCAGRRVRERATGRLGTVKFNFALLDNGVLFDDGCYAPFSGNRFDVI